MLFTWIILAVNLDIHCCLYQYKDFGIIFFIVSETIAQYLVDAENHTKIIVPQAPSYLEP